MKHTMIALTAFATCLAAAADDTVYTYTDGNNVEWKYTIVSGTNVRLGQSTELTGNIVNQNVKAIADDVTVDASTIPWTFTNNGTDYTVTEIAAAAFATRANLVGTLRFPETVKVVGERAFQKCNGLTALTSLGGVTNLNSYAFNECDNLGGFFPDIARVSVFGGGPFQYAGRNGGMTGTVRLNKNATAVSTRMFAGTYLTGTILIPSNVTSIRDLAFNEAKLLKGAWIAGLPYVSSGTQPQTGVYLTNVFRYNNANELTVFGPNTRPTNDSTLTGQWQNFGKDVNGVVLLPSNGKWDGFTLNSPNATVDFYDFAMELDEDRGLVKIKATTEDQLYQALKYAPKFKSVFGFDTKITTPSAVTFASGKITRELVDAANATFDALKFSVKTQTELNALLAAIPATEAIAIDTDGATEDMALDTLDREVYVRLPYGWKYQFKRNGLIILFR